MTRTSLPPGYRFHPTDVELVCYYLKRKVVGKPFHCDAITEIDLYKFAPWDLPEKSHLCSKDLEWYFLCPRDKKYPNGSRTNRTTESGYWKATGKDRSVEYNARNIGMKKTLIFHVGKPPRGDRTDWVMYEYRLEDKQLAEAGFSQDAYVLCKIFRKSGLGPKIGEQYGAPFNEADWEDDTNSVVSLPFLSSSSSKILHNQATTSTSLVPQSTTSAHLVPQSITSDVAVDPSYPDISGLEGFSVGVDPSDPDLSGLDGFSMDDFAEMLSSPVVPSDEKMLDTACDNNAEPSATDFEAMYNELEETLSAPSVMPGSNTFIEDAQIGCTYDSLLSELYNDQYLELNDLLFSKESDAFVMQECLLEQYPLNDNKNTSNVDTNFVSNSFCGGSETNLDAS